MARTVTVSMLWAVVCVQLAFFFILSTLYIWKEKRVSSVVKEFCPTARCPVHHTDIPGSHGSIDKVLKVVDFVFHWLGVIFSSVLVVFFT